MEKFIIEKLEGKMAVCETEDKKLVNIPRYKLPLEAKEGIVLVQDEEGFFALESEKPNARETRLKILKNKFLM